MELRHLRYFIRAAELLNFTKAAESLYVSQPTLSVQIRQLEDELGAELFARVGRSVQLTEAGRLFLARALQAVKVLEAGEREIDAIKGLLRGSMSLATLPLYGSRLLAGWITTFQEQHPQVKIRVEAAPSEDIELAILAGSIDLGLSLLPAQHADINSRELIKDDVAVLVHKDHPIAKKKSVSIKDFHDFKMVLPTERISATKLMSKYFEEHGITPNVSVTFDDGHAMLEMVKRGGFMTALPRVAVREDPELRFLPLPPPAIPISVGAIWTHLTPSTHVFLELMEEQARIFESSRKK